MSESTPRTLQEDYARFLETYPLYKKFRPGQQLHTQASQIPKPPIHMPCLSKECRGSERTFRLASNYLDDRIVFPIIVEPHPGTAPRPVAPTKAAANAVNQASEQVLRAVYL